MHLVRLVPMLQTSFAMRFAFRAPYRFRQRAVLISAMMIAVWVSPATAEPGDAAWLKEMARSAVFHVSVTGKLPTNPPTRAPLRSGKAFAVGPNLVVTSQHLLGDPEEWAQADSPSEQIRRLVRPLERTMSLRPANGDAIAGGIVLPAAFVSDVAGISIPNRKLTSYFRLSMCEISETRIYTAIMTEVSFPSDPTSIDYMTLVKLRPGKPNPSEYGSLLVFDTVEPPQFHVDPTGHDGSPVLDEDGSVVAIISAVVEAPGGGYRILATPIQPLFPVASAVMALAPASDGSADASLKCSLSDTVKRINDQVIAHATWSVDIPERDPDGLPEEGLYLRYESVAERPSIKKISFEYRYIGAQRKDEQPRELKYQSKDNKVNILTLQQSSSWKFALREIIIEGKEEVEPYLEKEKEGGRIDIVEIRIYKIELSDGRILKKDTYLTFVWRQPS